LDDHRAVFFNHKYTNCIVWNRLDGTITNFPVQTGTLGTANWRGGARMADGRFALVPFQQTQAKALNFQTNSVDLVGTGSFGGAGACSDVVVMDNGDLLWAAFNASVIVISQMGQGVRRDPELQLSPHAQ
jgi:hypothetical protein